MNGNENIPHLFLATLSKTKDFDKSLSQLLEKVGTDFDLSHITIRERNTLEYTLKTTYEWCLHEEDSSLNQLFPMTKSDWDTMAKQFDDEFFFYSTDAVTEKPSFFHVAILEKDLVGTISFEKRSSRHPWAPEELDLLKCVGYITANALLKNRAYRQADRAIDKITHFDPVTNLFTYSAFCDQATNLVQTLFTKQRMAILYVDIINFKYLNDTYGATEGDKLLRAFAHYIKKSPKNLCATRIFSDTFVMLVLLDEKSTPDSIQKRIKSISNHFLKSQRLLYSRCNLEIACGVSEVDESKVNIVHFVDKANAARKDLKARFGFGCLVFNQELEKQIEKENNLLNAIPNAFENQEFFFVLQPKVALETGKITGAEALVRWKRSDESQLPPSDFIPLMEKTGDITRLDFFVYESVCKYLQERLRKGLRAIPISVNVSRRHFKNLSFVQEVQALTLQYDIPPELLEFELTETLFLDNPEEALFLQENLHKAGFTLSLDDFGSGYSSLNLLKKMTLDVIKIDKSFLEGESINSVDKVIIDSIIHMAKLLKITVLCEGAETLEQVQYLRKAHCKIVQGFYFSKPISVEAMNLLLDTDKIFVIPNAPETLLSC